MNHVIKYAELVDGIVWTRKDEGAEIDVSNERWDSELINYPAVFKHKEEVCILYCGNCYGKTGFGLALRESTLQS